MANNAQKAAVLEEVIEHIHRLHEDVRAEVVVGELLDNQIQQESVTVQMKNVFTRAFARDILGARLDDSQPYHPYIALQLSRDGLYDRLPEGLFHDFSSQRRSSVSDMVANYKKQQQQQQYARKFFQPLEHEFFYNVYFWSNGKNTCSLMPLEKMRIFCSGLSGALAPHYPKQPQIVW